MTLYEAPLSFSQNTAVRAVTAWSSAATTWGYEEGINTDGMFHVCNVADPVAIPEISDSYSAVYKVVTEKGSLDDKTQSFTITVPEGHVYSLYQAQRTSVPSNAAGVQCGSYIQLSKWDTSTV